MRQKHIAPIILTAVFLLLGGVAGYVFLKNRFQESQWESYTNSLLGFSMRLPVKVSVFGNTGGVTIAEHPETSSVSFSPLGEQNLAWNVVIRDIQSDDGLAKFVQEMIAPGCELGERRRDEKNNLYNVFLANDGMDSLECPVNSVLIVKYSPEKKKAAFWNAWQECVFQLDASADKNKGVVPQEFCKPMIDSFQFL